MDNLILNLGLFISATLLSTTPLLLAGLGSCFSERCGVINLGIEGMMSLGASVAAIVVYYTHNVWLAFFVGGLSGALLGVLHAFVCINCHADQTIAGTAINFIGPGLAVFVCRIYFNGGAVSFPIDVNDKMPRMFSQFLQPGTFLYNVFGSYVMSYVVFIFAVLVWFVFYKTRFGVHLRACGEHPEACESVGIDVYRVRYICVILSGFLAALGGAFITLAVVSQFRSVVIVGQGFIAIAAVIFGKFDPKKTTLACLFFGACDGIKTLLSSANLVSANLLSLLPYVITIIILIVFINEQSVPAANGKKYYRTK